MGLRPLFSTIAGKSRGHRTLIAGVMAAAIAVAIIVPLTLSDRQTPPPADIFHAEGCASAPAIDPPPDVASAGAWTRLGLPADASCAKLGPTDSDPAGVGTSSAFVLTAAEEISVTSLRERLVIEPAMSYEADQESPRTIRITPRSALAAGTVYRVALLDAPAGRPVTRWAFQTRSPLRVVQTLPRHGSSEVPLNIGIELTFSHDRVTGVEERFSISPKTDGRFETHKRVLVFVPNELKPRTLYTVTLKPGVRVEGSGQTMTDPFTFRFETGTSDRAGETPGGPTIAFTRAVWESATAERPVVSFVYLGRGKAPATLPLTVYRFAGVEPFLKSLDGFTTIPSWASFTRGGFVAGTKGLMEVLRFNGRVERLGPEGDLYVRFPDAVAAGFYLVQAKLGATTTQVWLQSTDVATYAAISGDRTLVWANDIARKAPLSAATIRVAGGSQAGITGGDGVASFATPPDMIKLTPSEYGQQTEIVRNLLVTAKDGRLAVVPLADIFSGFQSFDYRSYTFSGDPAPYWRFLYADRDLYRTTDSVRFWGLIRKRTGPQPQRVTLELTNTYSERTGGGVTIARTTVESRASGTFIGELPFAGAFPGYYELRASIGDQTVASTWMQVEDFVKPAYKIDVTPSKRAVVSGEQVRFDISSMFFEGTPVPNVALQYTLEESSQKFVTTDDTGAATVRFRPTDANISDRTISLYPKRAEEGEIVGGASVRVFPSTVALRSTGTFAGGRARVDGVVFNVDFAALNAGAGDPYDFEGAPASGRRVTARVTEVSWRKVATGTQYDFINKIVRKTYRYVEVKRSRGSYSDVSDAEGRFAISFVADKRRSYEIDLRVADPAGRVYRTQDWVYTGYDYFNAFPYLAPTTEGPYAIGDRVGVVLRASDADMPSGGSNRYLFYTAANGIRSYDVSRTSAYAFRFAESHVPNVEVLAVRFNGASYEEVGSGYSAIFDASSRRLTIDVRPEKPRYRPGETARLAVRVTDARGRPARAEVLLSAVDEALFRIHPESYFRRDIVESLYDPIPAGVLRAYASHQYPRTRGGAEYGGEGPERVDFRDVGIFTRVTTGADGRAVAPFKLPDNLTSWRVTALAVSENLSAGQAVALVPVGLPVFADVSINDTYLTGDRPFARLRAFGSELEPGDVASFTVRIPTLSSKALTADGRAFTPVDVALPKLREGIHPVSITVSAHGRTDTLVRTVRVVDSRALRIEATTQEVVPGGRSTVPGSDERPTTVVLTDHNRGRYYPALEDLSWSYGDRVDQMLARNTAQDLLSKYFDEPSPFPAVFQPSAYQTDKGGVAIFPFADDDLVVSARIAALDPMSFGRAALSAYFWRVLSDPKETRERAIIALYGLSALGEPMLIDVQRAAALKDLSVRERLFVGLAAAELGDDDTARTIYRDLLRRYGEIRGSIVRLNVGKDRTDILEATALASILGAGLGDDAAAPMFDHVSRSYSGEILTALEQISFLVEALPKLSSKPAIVSYVLDGERITKELAKGASVVLVLTPSQRETLDLRVTQGTVGVASSTLVPFTAGKVKADPQAKIVRSIDGKTGGTVTIREGDVVRIELDYTLGPKSLDGCYEVTDLLPSGLRAVTRPYERGLRDGGLRYPHAIEGQRVSFCVYAGSQDRTIAYYARVIGRGTFTAEPATIQSLEGPELMSVTRPVTVEIR